MVKLRVNGQEKSFDGDPSMPLLWYLRDELGLTGTKFGCGVALCGACTVHVEGQTTRACITAISDVDGRSVTTIEGLDPEGNIQVTPGDQLPGVRQNRLKVNADYAVTDKWKLGGNLIYTSSQFFFGDASNQNPKLPGYWAVQLHSAYQVTENVELFAIIQNLFNNNYATFGIFGDVTKTPLPGVASPSDPRFVTLAAPVAVFGGIRVKF